MQVGLVVILNEFMTQMSWVQFAVIYIYTFLP